MTRPGDDSEVVNPRDPESWAKVLNKALKDAVDDNFKELVRKSKEEVWTPRAVKALPGDRVKGFLALYEAFIKHMEAGDLAGMQLCLDLALQMLGEHDVLA